MRKHIIGILGGSGFVGFSLAKHLSSTFDIKILDVREPKDESLVFEFCDVRDYEQVKKALKDVDLVIHTAIIQIPYIRRTIVLGGQVGGLRRLRGLRSAFKIRNFPHDDS